MLGNSKSKRHIIHLTFAILAIGLVYSVATTVFASGDDAPTASLMNLDAAIKGSENVPNISIGQFLENTVKNTGINAMINGQEEVPDLIDPSKMDIVPGWQRLMMMAIGFLIIYLGAAKGFEPLLLLPIGLFAFSVATFGGVLMAKIMNLFLKDKINPLIGSAGVSAFRWPHAFPIKLDSSTIRETSFSCMQWDRT